MSKPAPRYTNSPKRTASANRTLGYQVKSAFSDSRYEPWLALRHELIPMDFVDHLVLIHVSLKV